MYNERHSARLQFMFGLMIVLLLILWVRIGDIQFFRHERCLMNAINQCIKPVTLTASRGRIVDRNYVPLAVNLASASYGIRPEEVEDISSAVHSLSIASGISVALIEAKLKSQKNFFWLVRNANVPVMRNLDMIDIKGLHKSTGSRRYYPLGKVGSHVIGYTDIDGRGIEGCELYVDGELSGRNGHSRVFKDAKGRDVQSFEMPDIEPQDGLDAVLTIDWRIQEIAEDELEEIVRETNAVWGGAIVLNTGTGEILAMSNVPHFNPNDPAFFNPNVFDPANRRNRLVTDMFEPGSTYKIVTFIEALESGILNEDDLIDCENGKYKVSRHIINDTHELGIVPAREVLIHSSNIGSSKIGEMIGKNKLYKRSRLMGFGSVTGIDVPDESEGQLPNPAKWSKLSLPTISFGHGVAASPIQLAMAYAAVANDGLLVRPYIIKEVIGKGERYGRKTKVQKIRSALSAETARKITELLCEAVESGTGKAAALSNVRVAGKTGTAQRVMDDGSGYEPGKYISSFVGFITDREPKILCLVMVDSPEGVYYGSQVAAPAFKRIINRILNLGNGPWVQKIAIRSDNTTEKSKILPNLKNMGVRAAITRIHDLGFTPLVIGDSTRVVKQFPAPGTSLNSGGRVTLYSDIIIAESGNRIKVPDLNGKTVRDAVQELIQLNLKVSIKGSGIVSSQKPAAGSLIKPGTECVIACNKR